MVYIFIQTNFSLVSHNFGIRGNQFTSLTQFFIILLMLVVTYTYHVYNISISFLYNSTYLLWTRLTFLKPNLYVFYTLITLFILSLVILSFYPLFIDFIKQVFKYDLLNIPYNFYIITLFIFLLSYILLYRVYVYLILLVLLISLNNNYFIYLPVVLIFYKNNWIYILHLCILIFLLTTISNLNIIWTDWFILDKTSITNIYKLIYDPSLMSFSFNNCNIEVIVNLFLNNIIIESIWNFFWKNSTPEIHTFLHVSSNNFNNQLLFNGFFLQKLIINIFDNVPIRILSIVIIAFCIVLKIFKKKSIIIY